MLSSVKSSEKAAKQNVQLDGEKKKIVSQSGKRP